MFDSKIPACPILGCLFEGGGLISANNVRISFRGAFGRLFCGKYLFGPRQRAFGGLFGRPFHSLPTDNQNTKKLPHLETVFLCFGLFYAIDFIVVSNTA